MNAALPMMKCPAAILSSALMGCLLLASCSSIPMPSFLHNPASEAVVYALGPREGFASPLNDSLKPACPALVFENANFQLTSAHQQALKSLVQEMGRNKKTRLLVAGYTAPNLPADHARSLSERRSLAVRQRLIELGLEAASLQTVGFGNDFSPSGPSSDVVVIYRQN